MDEYYYIKISNVIFIIWLVIAIFFSIATFFLIFVIPICYYFILKSCKYYYNNERLVIETGILNKKQRIIPLYRIINISAQDNIFNYGSIYIRDKEQTIILKYVDHSKNEMLKLTEKWEIAKRNNIRNEVI